MILSGVMPMKLLTIRAALISGVRECFRMGTGRKSIAGGGRREKI
jgi:hypothetical protein